MLMYVVVGGNGNRNYTMLIDNELPTQIQRWTGNDQLKNFYEKPHYISQMDSSPASAVF